MVVSRLSLGYRATEIAHPYHETRIPRVCDVVITMCVRRGDVEGMREREREGGRKRDRKPVWGQMRW